MSSKAISAADCAFRVEILPATNTFTPMDSMVTSPTSPPSSTTALPVAPPAAHLSHPPSYDVHLAMHPDAAGQPSIALPARPSLPPPEYSEVPETRAERMFWYGLLMPLCWIVGALYLFRSQDSLSAARAKDPEAQSSRSRRWRCRRGRAGPTPTLDEPAEEMRALWRAEEVVWAKRCLRGAAFFTGVVAIAVLAVAYTQAK